jgi:Skp family chaperone for outer membrane proteins
MKLPFFPYCLLGLTWCGLFTGQSHAQSINVGVVDMQECLNQYFQTKTEVEKINALAKRKQAGIDAMSPDFEALTNRLTALDSKLRDTAISDQKRRTLANDLQNTLKERMAKGREIEEAKRKAQAEIVEARQMMELDLVSTIRKVVDARAAEAGLDLVFDKSFLPKANKVILVTSPRVPDLTAAVIADLNRQAPADFTTASPAGTPAGTAGTAASASAGEGN